VTKRPYATAALAFTVACVSSLAAAGTPSILQTPQDPQPKPTFRSAVDLVSVAAVVRDRKGRFAPNLRKEDFVVQEGGSTRELVDFRADDNGPVRVALLFDVSGSMRLATRLEDARSAARQVLSALRLGPSTGSGQVAGDEAAVFSFDMNLQSLQPFTADASAIESALARVLPYGQTSLYDAIAQTARNVVESRPGDSRRRAVIVFTDGLDTSSELTPQQVSAVAAAIDVPVYVMTVMADVDREKGAQGQLAEGPLRDLSRATGGELFVTSAPAHESIAARQIVDELRHQYVLSFAASPAAGWHGLTVKTKNKDLTVRARSGYTAGRGIGSVAEDAAAIFQKEQLR
jgi:Ca-activated chloride channel family protein